jgi:carbamoyl-phosphate synthase large subunit
MGWDLPRTSDERPLEDLMDLLSEPTSERQFIMYEAIRKGATVADLHQKTHIKEWFIEQMRELVALEEEILNHKGKQVPDELLVQAKKRRLLGPVPFADSRRPGKGHQGETHRI